VNGQIDCSAAVMTNRSRDTRAFRMGFDRHPTALPARPTSNKMRNDHRGADLLRAAEIRPNDSMNEKVGMPEARRLTASLRMRIPRPRYGFVTLHARFERPTSPPHQCGRSPRPRALPVIRTALITIILALLVTGCGTSATSQRAKHPANAGTVASTAVAARTATNEASSPSTPTLQQMLLTASEVPAGYKVVGYPSGQPPKQAASGTKSCGQLSHFGVKDGGGASATFSLGPLGPFLIEALGAVPDTNNAKSIFDQLRHLIGACKTFESTDAQGTTTHFTVSELASPTLGDDHVALRVAADAGGGNLAVDLAVVRVRTIIVTTVGTTLATIMGGALFPLDQLQAFTRSAVEKVQRLT
jgi:hypothetical protein